MTTLLRNILLIFIFVFSTTKLLGQPIDSTKKFRQIIEKYDIKFILKTNIIPPVISAINNRISTSFIVEYCFMKRYSVQGEWVSSSYNSASTKESSDIIIAGFKYFLSQSKNYTGFYTGYYNKAINYYYANEQNIGLPQIYTQLIYNKEYFGIGLIFGYQNYIKSKIVYDFIVSIGALYNTRTEVLKAVNIELSDSRIVNIDGIIGLNIGYKF